MFSKNVYMFPHGSPSSQPRGSAAVLGVNGNEIFLHHHHDMLPGHYSAGGGAFSNHDGNGLNGDPSSMENPCELSTKASKKDRHSKIYTAQGPRDRRVRLSIGVARKFFDLQEVLGFDKPSKTLDWLLTKSKAAIKDLVQMRERGSTKSASSAPSECEVDSGDAYRKGKSVMKKDPTPPSNPAKESRVKARARARERTREKMSIKKLNETRNYGGGGYDLNPSIPIQIMNNQLEFRKISGSSSNNNLGMPEKDLIQESIVIKRKVKHPSSILGFQQNLIISSSNYGVPSPYNAAVSAENWDISSFAASQSNICAILDQHKFING